jgi:ribonuclease HI
VAGERRLEMSGGFRLTTNNRMEILAAVKGLERLNPGCQVTVYSDSQYLVNAVTKGWAKRWRARGWMRTDAEPARNPDLWERLLDLCTKHHVVFRWVRGHAGHEENERCDTLAVAALKGAEAVDLGYEGEGTIPAPGPAPGPAPAPAQVGVPDGPPCPACGAPLQRRTPKRKLPKPGSFWYEWFHACPKCGRNFMPEEARRSWETHPEWREL